MPRVPAGTRASAIDRFSVGEKLPLVTSPGPAAVVTCWWLRSTPRSSSSSPTSSKRGAARGRFECGASDELPRGRFECHGPRDARSERVMIFVEIVAVEAQARFQAQGVARTESGRPHARGAQRTPRRRPPLPPAARSRSRPRPCSPCVQRTSCRTRRPRMSSCKTGNSFCWMKLKMVTGGYGRSTPQAEHPHF